jgi:hypothetical protein
MEYFTQVLWLLTWPLLIFVSYKLVIFALKKWNLYE